MPGDLLMRALRKATVDCSVVPVLCGSAFKNKGVQRLLDAVVDYLPSPAELPPTKAVNLKTDEEEDPAPTRRRSVQRPRVQGDDRPVRRLSSPSCASIPAR